MTPEELERHIRNLADSRCRAKHPDYYNSLICVGPGSAQGFSPPCYGCVDEVRRELAVKREKAQGHELSPEEAAEVRKKL